MRKKLLIWKRLKMKSKSNAKMLLKECVNFLFHVFHNSNLISPPYDGELILLFIGRKLRETTRKISKERVRA